MKLLKILDKLFHADDHGIFIYPFRICNDQQLINGLKLGNNAKFFSNYRKFKLFGLNFISK